MTLLGRATGKVGAMARAARKSRKRFGAALAPFVLGDAALRERRGELMHLDRFEAVRDFPTLATSVGKLAHAGYMTELVRELLPERAPDPRAFDLYREALELLDAGDPSVELLRAFELGVLEVAGLRPMLDACVRCGGGDAAAGFDPASGVVCASCGPGPVAMAESTRRDLCGRQALALAQAAARPMARECNAEARTALVTFVQYHLGRKLRSVDVIAQLAR